MDWPTWLNDATTARSAFIVSLASAAFTGGTLYYTRRLANNDTKRMKRKAPILEFLPGEEVRPDGWQTFSLRIRNLEPVAVYLVSVKTKSRTALLANQRNGVLVYADDNAWNRAGSKPMAIEGDREMTIGSEIGPDNGRTTYSTWVYSKGARKPSDLILDWYWADGSRR